MGSFNLGCVLSDLQIRDGDKYGVLLMKQNTTTTSHYHTMHVYSTDMYAPVLPIIWGTYGDYGYITDVEESDTTRYLQDLYKVDVATLLNMLGNEDREVYSQYGPFYENFYEGEKWDWNANLHDISTAVGFTAVVPWSKSNPIGEYSYGGHIVKVSGSSTNDYTIDGQRVWDVEKMLTEFTKKTQKFPGYPESVWPALEFALAHYSTTVLKGVYDKVMASYTPETFGVSPAERVRDGWKVARNLLQDEAGRHPLGFQADMDFYEIARMLFGWRITELNRILMGFPDPEPFLELNKFMSLMTDCNKLFNLSFAGRQWEDLEAAKALNDAIGITIEERTREEDES